MQLKSVETFSGNFVSYVRVTDTDGNQGWGMVGLFSADITATILHRLAADIALQPFDDFTTVADTILRKQYKFLGTLLSRAAAGIDTALWDLESKKKGISVAELAGKKRDYIDVYASSMKRDLPVQEEADRLRALQDKYGYRAVKLHPAIPVGFNEDYWPGRTEDMIVAMVKTATPDTHIIVDVNGNYSVDKAIDMAKFMHEHGIKLLEEPCPYWEFNETRAVREACEKIGIKVSGGEQDCVDSVWNHMIDTHVMDVCQPNLLISGGFTKALRIAKRAAEKGLQVTPHTSNQSPIFVMGLHYMACIDTPYPFLECGIEDDAWSKVYNPHPDIKDGKVTVPTVPGWGFEPKPEFLEKSIYQISTR